MSKTSIEAEVSLQELKEHLQLVSKGESGGQPKSGKDRKIGSLSKLFEGDRENVPT